MYYEQSKQDVKLKRNEMGSTEDVLAKEDQRENSNLQKARITKTAEFVGQ